MKTYIGIDNGVTGSIGVIYENGEVEYISTPTFPQLSYTKKAQNITRIDTQELRTILSGIISNSSSKQFKILIERPFVNPTGFKATQSSMRSLEATLIVLEDFGLSYEYIDSKEWQKKLLPEGIKGTANLKSASADIGLRLYPQLKREIAKQKDADGILIAEHGRRSGL